MELLIFCQAFVAWAVTANIKVCRNERDCGEDRQCNNGVCQKCFSCKQLFKKGKSCVFDFNECGDCLEGFEETLITDFSSAIKPCKPVKLMQYSKCRKDEDCLPNEYCVQNSCAKCFDCKLYKRLPPSKECAKEFNECGSCFDGFTEVPVTTLVNTKPCEKKNISLEKILEENFIFEESFAASICAVLGLCLLYIFWSIKLKKKRLMI